MRISPSRLGRRRFLQGSLAAGAAAVVGVGARPAWGQAPGAFEVGKGVVDITPPIGAELAGFHLPEGQKRLITGIRQPAAVRALVLRVGDAQAAIVSMDIIVVSDEMSARTRQRIEEATGIPAAHVRICATHTHSMPTFYPLLQWGGVPKDYMATVEDRMVDAVRMAKEDLAAAELSVGSSRAVGGNFNRTAGEWKTDEQFTADATDDDRWLDTLVQALRFDRAGGKPPLLWYHFSAHPVCYTDTEAGPDWPGLVAKRFAEEKKITPSFLQGHAGDVNPGDGTPWIGDPAETTDAVYAALVRAADAVKPVKVDTLRMQTAEVGIPLDQETLKSQLERYRADPSHCTSGEWVDAGFAKAWFEGASKWDTTRTHWTAPVAAMRLGEVGWLFHPSELFSYYGLSIRRQSPLPHTLVVGYVDGIIGYLPDPKLFAAAGYEASVVPKILGIPPFQPTAARDFTAEMVKLGAEVLG